MSLAGQKWEAWKKIICKTSHFATFSVIFCLVSATFGWFLPYFPVFPPLLPVLQPFIFHFCPLAGQLGRKAWYSSLAEHMAPPGRKKFWQEGIEFWQDEVVGPPSKMTQIRLCPPELMIVAIFMKM